jgi:hypothetical protein
MLLAFIYKIGVIYKTFHRFSMNDPLDLLAQALDHDPFAIIVTEQRCFSGRNEETKKRRKMSDDSLGLASASASAASLVSTAEPSPKNTSPVHHENKAKVVNLVSGIVSRIDLIDFISKGPS